MVTAIDTNIAVEFLRNNKKVLKLILSYETVYLPITVVGELLFGALNFAKSEEMLKKTQEFIQKCKILNINYIVAKQYAKIRKELKLKGKPIPENDIWIAAICSANNISLVTNDKHFKNIDENFLQIVK